MEQLWITALLNRLLGGPVNALLQKLPPAFHPADPNAPISNAVAVEILVIALLLLIFICAAVSLTLKPFMNNSSASVSRGVKWNMCPNVAACD